MSLAVLIFSDGFRVNKPILFTIFEFRFLWLLQMKKSKSYNSLDPKVWSEIIVLSSTALVHSANCQKITVYERIKKSP